MTRGRRLSAGNLEAVFLPRQGMLGASLRHRGVELLRRVEDLDAMSIKGGTAGIPLLYPWANRLAGLEYHAAGKRVLLDRSSPLLRLDDHGLPIHGVPWPRLEWQIIEATENRVAAALDWHHSDLLDVFPFRHRVELMATLDPEGLTIQTTVCAGPDGAVPVSFGFHPYFGIPTAPRAHWKLELPAMRELLLDQRGIPTGQQEAFGQFDGMLGDLAFDDGFALPDERVEFSVSGAGRRISVKLLEGYGYAQVFAPEGKDYIALEPMTAPTSALTSGTGLRLVEPGARFPAAFGIRVEEIP